MSVSSNIISNINGFSVAMYSTWMYYRSEQILFDAGEGVSTSMCNRIGGIDKIFVSHGHHDHIGGIMGIIGTRASAMLAKDRPFTIYHPGGWDTIRGLKSYVSQSYPKLPYELSWIQVDPGSRIQLSGSGQNAKSIRVFKADHTRGIALGFQVVENRKKLKKEFFGMEGREIGAIKKAKGEAFVTENYEHVCLIFSGDTSPLDDGICSGSDVLIHEGTFVDPADMGENGHSSIADVVRVAVDSKVGALVIYHLSSRYSHMDAVDRIKFEVSKMGFNGPVFLLDGKDLAQVSGHVTKIGEGKV